MEITENLNKSNHNDLKNKTHELKNKVFYDDSLKKLRFFANNSIDAVITDPPYFIDSLADDWNISKNKQKSRNSKIVNNLPAGMKFSKKQGILLYDFYFQISKEIFRILKPGAFFISFAQPRLYHKLASAVEDNHFEIRDMFCWGRNTRPKSFSIKHFITKDKKIDQISKMKLINETKDKVTPQLSSLFEPIVLAQKPKEGTFLQNWIKWQKGLLDARIKWENKKLPSFLFHNKTKEDKFDHMTVKPLKIIEYLINITTNKNDLVLDPFLGSGTTAIACLKNQRFFCGIEKNKEYFDICLARIKKYKAEQNNGN